MKKNKHKDKIINLSKSRWIFIAGNLPYNKDKLLNENKYFKNSEDILKEKIQNFVCELTMGLIHNNFNVASCPQVEDVGRVVSSTYLETRKKYTDLNTDYRIGGLYPVDMFTRETTHPDTEILENWKHHLNNFRKSYLAYVEWLILIGGGTGTREEFDAAQKINTKILLVPFFWGTSMDLWKNNNNNDAPYSGWDISKKIER